MCLHLVYTVYLIKDTHCILLVFLAEAQNGECSGMYHSTDTSSLIPSSPPLPVNLPQDGAKQSFFSPPFLNIFYLELLLTTLGMGIVSQLAELDCGAACVLIKTTTTLSATKMRYFLR